MKMPIRFLAVLSALVLPIAVSAQGVANLANLANPDDVMLRKPTVQKPAAPAIDAAAAQKAREDAAELKRLRDQVAAEKKAREAAAARAQAAEAAARAAQEQAQTAAAQARAAEEAKAAAEREKARVAEEAKVAAEKARQAAEEAKAQKPKLQAPVQTTLETVPPAGAKSVVPNVAKKSKKQLTGKPAVITADRTDYDRKEGVILFDRNVYVNDEQYQMHADRLWVFLDGTNDLKRIVALGNVSITNDEKSAACAKAVYNRAEQRITMFGDSTTEGMAWLRDAGTKAGDGSEIQGERITYWLDTGLASVDRITVTLPGIKGSSNPKDMFNPKAAGKKGKKADNETDK